MSFFQHIPCLAALPSLPLFRKENRCTVSHERRVPSVPKVVSLLRGKERYLASSGKAFRGYPEFQIARMANGGRDNHCNLIVLALPAPMWVPPWAFCWKTL